jgi:hypothetical protein
MKELVDNKNQSVFFYKENKGFPAKQQTMRQVPHIWNCKLLKGDLVKNLVLYQMPFAQGTLA